MDTVDTVCDNCFDGDHTLCARADCACEDIEHDFFDDDCLDEVDDVEDYDFPADFGE